MDRLVASLASTCALLLCLCGSLPSAAQLVDPTVAGRWQGSSGGITASIALTTGADLSGTLSGGAMDGCFLDGHVQRIVSSAPTAWVGRAVARMAGCTNPSLIKLYDVLLVVVGDRLSLEFVGQGGGRQDSFIVAGLTRAGPLLGTGGSVQIVDARIPGHWQGTQGGWTATLDLTAQGQISGTLNGPNVVNCTFTASISWGIANVQGSFHGRGGVTMSGCFEDGWWEILLVATPDSLYFSIFDPQDDDGSDFVGIGGMTHTAGVGASADAREAKAGMWNSPLGSGWGLSLVTGKTAQRTPFVVLYVYGSDRTPTWYVMSSGAWKDDNNFEGDLYATTGSDWRSPSFDSRSVTVKKVGTLLMSFTSESVGRLTYQINDGNATYVSSMPMVKQEF